MTATLAARITDYGRLMRLERPIGALLLLWPTLWALWLAGSGRPPRTVVLIFLAGVWIMRSAGCVINDYADRNYDPHVSRTRDRPLAARRVTEAEALGLFAVLCLAAFVLVLQLNLLTVALAFPGVLLAASYPFMKRYHHLPQAHLGAAFGWGIPMAFAAVTGSVPPVAWVLFLANVLWSMVYDTQYAMVDREDDLKVGLKSSAILFGQHDRWIIGVLQVLMLALLIAVGRIEALAWPYYLGLLAAAGAAAYQQVLIRHREPPACFRAFLNNNLFGLAVFCGVVLALLPE